MVIVRQETVRDISDVASVNRIAFGRNDEARLVDLLRETVGFIPELSLVAEVDGRVVGHLLLTEIRIHGEHRHYPALALAPMSVTPELQNQGIGSALVREGLTRARDLGHAVVVVLGHAEYYPRFGFEPASHYRIRAPFPVPDDSFMVYALVPGALDDIEGVVRYPPEFDTV